MIRLTRGTPSSGWNLSLEELLFGLLSEGRFFRFSVGSHAGRAEFRLSDGVMLHGMFQVSSAELANRLCPSVVGDDVLEA